MPRIQFLTLSSERKRRRTESMEDRRQSSKKINQPGPSGMNLQERERLRSALNRKKNKEKLPPTYRQARLLNNYNEVRIHNAGLMSVCCIYCKAKLFQKEVKNNSSSICCHHGKIQLDDIECPMLLQNLIEGTDSQSVNFLQIIRQYNNALAFASVKVNRVNMPARGPFCFKIHGQMYHMAGSLLPADGTAPSYAGLFFVDSHEALAMRLLRKENDQCDINIMRRLQNMLEFLNPYAQLFSFVKNIAESEDKKLIFSTENSFDKHRYSLFTGEEVAAAFVTDNGAPPTKIDFVIRTKSTNKLTSISSLNPHCDPMCYPLLFPCGDSGWKPGMKHVNIHSTNVRNSVTQLQYYCHRLSVREGFSLLHASGKLFQQYVVDAFVKVEGSRIAYIKSHQKDLRVESYKELKDFLHSNAQSRGMNAGIPVVLPSSFIGSPRNMLQNYQDAMSIVARFGKPDIFLTFTANPKWEEIVNNLKSYEKSENRPDLIVRVFYLKLLELLSDLHENHVFGVVSAYVDVIEFQKRGLPHAHMLLILRTEDKVSEPEEVDSIVAAEIPDFTENPRLYNIVKQCMVHGPCGMMNPSAPCMEDGKCTKNFPKEFCEETKVNVEGYPLYRRRNNGRKLKIRNFAVDNRWIVPYNPYLTLKYVAHINVEICSSVRCVKYLYKFIYKGHDAAALLLESSTENQENLCVNEPTVYLNVRYVSPPEAVWRLHERPMQNKSHCIERLPVHLPGEELIYFMPGQEGQAIDRATSRKTKLTAYFELCNSDDESCRYTYTEIPEHYVWSKDNWIRRKKATRCIGRMYTVNPLDRERYFLRVLLLHVKGVKCFEDVRRVNGILCPTFASAAQNLKLVDNDEEWYQCLEEASSHQIPKQLRELFSIICVFCVPDSPSQLWDSFKEFLSGDYSRMHDSAIAQNLALCDLESLLIECGTCCESLGLPEPTINNETGRYQRKFCIEEEKHRGMTSFNMLNEEQKGILLEILKSVYGNEKKQFFVDGPGGTGKTFLYKTLCSILRGQNKVVLPVAWTGIAANLLDGGITAHSLFKFPVPILETSVSNIRQNSEEGTLLKSCSLIVWDEISMVPKEALRILDKLLQELTRTNYPFGGKTIVFGGDFRQVLPVVRNGNRSTVVESCVKYSPLWSIVQCKRLTLNMRTIDDPVFSDWLLKLGNGELTVRESIGPNSVDIPKECFCVREELINTIFNSTINEHNVSDICNKAILCPKNDDCLLLNEEILDKLVEGESRVYYSSDSVIYEDGQDQQIYSVEFLNSLNPSGLPPHKLTLKKNSIVILLRNLNQKVGLVNGAKLIVTGLHDNYISVKLIGTESFIILPRIVLIPSDHTMPFKLRRKQFPIKLAFAMTINKAQGQTLNKVGIFLPHPVFSHGQLYVAFSRGKKFEDIKICIAEGSQQKISERFITTSNIVYKEVL